MVDSAHEEGDISLDVCGEILHGCEEFGSGGNVDGAIDLEHTEHIDLPNNLCWVPLMVFITKQDVWP